MVFEEQKRATQLLRQSLSQQQQQYQQARTQIQKFQPKIQQTKAQLLRATIQSQVKIRAEQLKRGTFKKEALQKVEKEIKRLEPIQKEIEARERAIASAERNIAEWKEAERLVKSGSRFEGTPSLRAKVQQLREAGVMQSSEFARAVGESKEFLKKQAEKPEIVMSEEAWKDFESRIKGGEDGGLKERIVGRQIAVIPTIELEAMGEAYKILEKGTGAIITEEIAKQRDLSEAQRKLYTITPDISDKMTEEERKRIYQYLPKGIPEPSKVTLMMATPLAKYQEAEKWTRERTTYPLFEKAYQVTGMTKEEFAKLSTEIGVSGVLGKGFIMPTFAPEIVKKAIEPAVEYKREVERGIITGVLTGIKEKPLKIGALAVASYFVAPAVATIGWGARAIGLAKIPALVKGAKVVGVGVKYGLPALYVTTKGVQIYQAPTPFEKGFVVGEAVSTEIAPIMAGHLFGSKLATRIASKEMISNQMKQLSPKQRAKFKAYMKEIARLQKEGHPPVKRVTLEGMDRIPKNARNPTLRHLKDVSNKGDLLGGSIAQRTQTYGIKRSYAQSDLDLYTKASSHQRALDYAKVLKNAGIDRVSVVGTTGRVTIKGVKVAEWHDMSAYAQNIYQAEGWFKPVKTTITKDPTGIRVMKLTSQVKRKLIGSYLQGRFAKDYPDFKKSLKSMYETARLRGIIKEPDEIRLITELKPDAKIDFLGKPPKPTKAPYYYKPPVKVAPFYFYPPTKKPIGLYPYVKPLKIMKPVAYLGKIPTKPITAIPTYPLKVKPAVAPKPVPYFQKPIKPIITIPTKPYKEPLKEIPPTITEIMERRPKVKIKKKIIKPKKKPVKAQSWDAYGKVIRTKIYKKLNKVPLTKERAKDFIYLIDHSLSTNLKLKPNPRKPQKAKLKIPMGYYEKTKHKYRDYKFKTIKGVRKKIPLKDMWIERTSGIRGTAPKGFRLDTKSEQRRISLLKKLSDMKRKAGLKPKKKRRKSSSPKSRKQIKFFG